GDGSSRTLGPVPLASAPKRVVCPRQFQSSVRVPITFTAEPRRVGTAPHASFGWGDICVPGAFAHPTRDSIDRNPLVAKGADVSRNVLNGPGRHENTADDRRRPCAVKPRRLYLLFRSHAMHALVDARADLENALRSTATVVEQNDHVGLLRELDRGSLARVGVAAHGFDDFDWRFGPAYPLDDLGENFGVAGDLTHQRNGAAVFVRQSTDVVRPLDHVAAAPVLIGYLFRDAAMMIVFRAHDRDVESLFGEPLHDAIKLFDERADQIVEQIDAARGQALLRLLVKSVKPEHQAIAVAQRRHVAHDRKLAQARIIGQQPCLTALDTAE